MREQETRAAAKKGYVCNSLSLIIANGRVYFGSCQPQTYEKMALACRSVITALLSSCFFFVSK